MQHSNVNLRIRIAHDDNIDGDAQAIAKFVAEALVGFKVVRNVEGPVSQFGRRVTIGHEDGPYVEVFLESAVVTVVTPR